MPRVPDSYRETRKWEILEAAQRCFAERGFGGTRMEDIAREAGLSTGAVYRYYASREELLRALAEVSRGTGRRLLAEVEASGAAEPYDRLIGLIRRYLTRLGPEADSALRLSVQLWGEATRHPELAAEIRRTYEDLVELFGGLVADCQATGRLSTDRAPSSVGRAVVAMLNEVGLQRLLGVEVDIEEYGRVMEDLLDGLV